MSVTSGVFIGFLGIAIYVLMYGALSLRRISATGVTYPLLNGIAAVCMLISLSTQWNLPSAVSNIIWLALSVYGLSVALRQRRNV